MSHFYGVLSGQSKTSATRRGSKKSGIVCTVASWDQGIRVELGHHEPSGKDWYSIYFSNWQGKGIDKFICQGDLPIK